MRYKMVRIKTMAAPDGISILYATNKPINEPVMDHKSAHGIIFLKLFAKSIAIDCGMVKMLSTNMMPITRMLITMDKAIRTDIKYLKNITFVPMILANSASKAV